MNMLILVILMVTGFFSENVKSQVIDNTTDPITDDNIIPSVSDSEERLSADTFHNISHPQITTTEIPNKPSVKPHFILCNKLIPVTLLHHFLNSTIFKAINDKINKINDFIEYTKHPNYPGLQLYTPLELWEKFQEKKKGILEAGSALISHLKNKHHFQDYPYPYKK